MSKRMYLLIISSLILNTFSYSKFNCSPLHIHSLTHSFNFFKKKKRFLYDVFSTVVDWRTTVTQELTSFATLTSTRCSIRSQISSKNWSEFAQKWHLRSMKRIQQSILGLEPFRKIDEINREILFSLIQEFDLPQYVWSDDEVDQLNLVWHNLDCYDDCVPGLSRLSERYVNATLSNANVRLLVDLKRHNHLHMLDYMFSAELFKEFIPKESTYLGACEMLNLDPGEVVMVASNYNNLLNAKKFGLRTVYVRREKEDNFNYDEYDNEYNNSNCGDVDMEFDWVVDNLEELADVMGC